MSLLKKILMYIYLILNDYFEKIWCLFFNFFEIIHTVYYVNNCSNKINCNHTIKNITLNYYSGLFLDEYINGTFFVKSYSKNGLIYTSYTGNICEISNIKPLDLHSEYIKRKNIIITDDKNEPLNVNLDIIDTYYTSIKNKKLPITNMKCVTSLLDLKCENITIIQSMPFLRQNKNINEIEINEIYYNN